MKRFAAACLILIGVTSEAAIGSTAASGPVLTAVGSYTVGLSLFDTVVTGHEAPWLRVVVPNKSTRHLRKPILMLNGPVLQWKLVDESGNDMPCSVLEGLSFGAFDGEILSGDSTVEYQQFGWDSWHVTLVPGRYALHISMNASVLNSSRPPQASLQFILPYKVRECDSSEDVGMELLRVADSSMRDKKWSECAETCMEVRNRFPGSLAARVAFRTGYYIARQHQDLGKVDWRDMAREFVIENCESPLSIMPARNLSSELGHAYVDSLIEIAVKLKAEFSPLYEVQLHDDE